MRLLITRPQFDAMPLAARLRELGHEAHLFPVIEIIDRPEAAADLAAHAPPAALAFTSANGARAFARLVARPDVYIRLRVFAVGRQTAEALAEAGWARDMIHVAGGSAASLAEQIAAAEIAGTLLHICGAHHRPLEGAQPVVFYTAQAVQSVPPEIAAALAAGEIDGILFYSPRSVRIFADLCDARNMPAFCLSPAIAAEAEAQGFQARAAASPDDDALCAMI